jgi:hypothetical protein
MTLPGMVESEEVMPIVPPPTMIIYMSRSELLSKEKLEVAAQIAQTENRLLRKRLQIRYDALEVNIMAALKAEVKSDPLFL